MAAQAAALITAAGSSSRMGAGPKKEFRLLPGNAGGKSETVLCAALRAFIQTKSFSSIVITCPPGQEEAARDALDPELLASYGGCLRIIPGGKSRRESVLYGLRALADMAPDYVLIHDGARPFLSPALIRAVLDQCQAHGAAVPLIPTVDSCKEVDEEGIILRHLNRARVMAVQTPQGFAYPGILEAHEKAVAQWPEREFTDDSEIWQLYRGPVSSVPGLVENIKITFAQDLS